MKARICKEKHWNVHLRFFLVMMGDLLFSVSVLAQSNLITGKVIDNASEPIIGASIQSSVVGKGTISNMNGDFSIEVPVGTELTISFLGYRTQKIKVSDMRSLVIKLLEDTQALDEVVVVGYGVQKKESLTGAISNIKNDEIIKTKATSLAQSLEGKVSGLKIRQNDGEPGQFRSDINIRGLGTPLFIIDGIVRDGANEFQRLNPDDIESISFLKDGTAAIYGMNSANGAIVVTTKKGYKGKAKISLSANWGWSKPTNIPRMANAAQYMELRNDAAILGEGNPLVTKEELELWKTGASGYASTDLYDHVIKNSSIQQQYTLSLQGGSDIVSYFGSFSYASDEGLLKSGDLRYEKFTFRSNTDIKIAKGLTAGVNLAGRYDKTSQPWNSFYEIFKQTRVNVPTVPAYANNNPDYLATQSMGINPIALADADMTGYHYYYNKNFQSTFTLKYEVPFVQGLSIQGQLGYDYNHNKHKGLRKKFSTYTYAIETDEYIENEYNNPSMIQVNNNEASRLDMQAQISYNRLFNDTHNVSATLVYERRQEKSDWSNIERKFDLLTYDEVDYAGLKDAVSGGMSNEQACISYVGLFNYD
uniref:SusC/RagA family TonB-linked outer membrane protein n=1 Tax=Bacteroides finegoldii TaxID=338188 RepID=UPI00242CC6BF